MKTSSIGLLIFLFWMPHTIKSQDVSWITINNTTKLDTQCMVQGVYYFIDDNQEILIDLYATHIADIMITWTCSSNDKDQNCLFLDITFDCKAESQTILNSVLFYNLEPCAIEVESVTCTHHPLQLQTSCQITDQNNREVVIEYNPDSGIDFHVKSISLYKYYLEQWNAFLQNIVAAALQTIHWLETKK